MREFEQRTYVRHPCVGQAALNYVGRTTETLAQVLNVSLGGCLLSFSAASALSMGDDLEMKLVIGSTSFEARGWVVAGANHQKRVGVIFASMTPPNRAALSRLIEELAGAHPRHVQEAGAVHSR